METQTEQQQSTSRNLHEGTVDSSVLSAAMLKHEAELMAMIEENIQTATIVENYHRMRVDMEDKKIEVVKTYKHDTIVSSFKN